MRKSLLYILITTMLLNILPASMAHASDGTMSGWWQGYANISSDTFTATLDNSTAGKGEWSAKIKYNNPSAPNVYGMFNTTVNGLEKGKNYKVGIMAKAKNARSFYMTMNWKQLFIPGYAKTFDWTEMNFLYTHSQDTTSETLIFIIDNMADALWIDNVYVREVLEGGGLGENLISNSSFEAGESEDKNSGVNQLNELYKKISESDTFSLSDMKKVLGAFKYAPVYKAENISIDGDLSDWEEYPQFGLPTKSDQYQIYQAGAARDATGFCQYAYDDEYFYLGISVMDNVFFGDTTKEAYWTGDSIQLAICDADENYDAEIGFVHNENTGEGMSFSSNYGDEDLKKINLKTSLKKEKDKVEIIYEAAIPWSLKYGDDPLPDGFLFDILINDNDGNGRAYCVELAPGISEGKTSKEFPYLEFLKDKKDFYGWADGDSRLKVGEEKSYNYYFVNEGEAKNVTISVPATGHTETVDVPANTCIKKSFNVKFDERGNNEVKIIASCSGETSESKVKVYVEPVASSFDDMLTDIDNKITELKGLLDKCSEQNISTDYPMVDYETIVKFKGLIEQDIGWQMYDRVYSEYDNITELYERAKGEIEAFLDGSKTPFSTTRYVTGNVKTDKSVFYATTMKDGVLEERPFWFTGYGHFEDVAKEIPNFNNFGTSIVQFESGPMYCIVKGTDGKMFNFSPTPYFERLIEYSKSAEENNVQICLNLSVHYIPEWVYTLYPDMMGKSADDVLVPQGTIKLHPAYKELLKTYIEGIMKYFGDSPALNSICLTNEPSNNANSTYYQGYWAQYLTQLYNADINNLNKAYGTDYKSFLDVPMQSTVSETRQFYDYMQFNDAIMVEFHTFLADCIKEINPDVPVHAKVMGMGCWRDDPGRRAFLTYGTDYEKYAAFSDFGGNDACGYIENTHWTLMDKMMNYDMLTGIKDAPCFNSEDHIISDRDTNWTDKRYKKFVETDQWQGALHGRGGSTVWTWGRTNDYSFDFMGLFLDRPDCVAAVGRTSLDINRLGYEAEAIVKQEPKVALLYSQEARMWNSSYMNVMSTIYENCLYNGQKVEFIPEGQMDRIHDYDVFIVPNALNVRDASFEEIKKYAENGGKLVVFGEDSLRADNLNNPRNEDDVKDVMSKAQVIKIENGGILMTSPTKDEVFDIMHDIFTDAGICNVEVVDSKTGERVKNCEFEYADYNGNTILNIANYTWEQPKTVKIMIDGKEAGELKELRSDTTLDNEFTVEPFSPMMIQIGENRRTGKFADISASHWAYNAISTLSDKNIVSGYDDNTFKPDKEITREEFVKIIVSALGIPTSEQINEFSDVAQNAWYAPYVNAAFKAGFVSGKGNSAFGVGEKITREEMAVIVRRAVSDIVNNRPYSAFSDDSEISDYAKKAIEELYSAGMINGISETEFSPKSIVTRAQAAKIIYDTIVK